MKIDRTSLPSWLTVSSARTLAARLGQHRNSPMKQIRAQTVDAAYPRLVESSNASEPMFAYEDREVPEMERVVVAPKGARLKSADVGVGRSPAGPDSKSKHLRGGRGGGPQGTGPSAAVGRLAPEERGDREVPGKRQRSVLSWKGRRLRAAGTGAYRYNDLCGAWYAVPTTPDDLCPPGRFRVILKAQTYCLRLEGSLPRNEYRPQPRARSPRELHPSAAVGRLAPEERAVGGIS